MKQAQILKCSIHRHGWKLQLDWCAEASDHKAVIKVSLNSVMRMYKQSVTSELGRIIACSEQKPIRLFAQPDTIINRKTRIKGKTGKRSASGSGGTDSSWRRR